MSRHYMVCPQNEEMLHKIPPRVRDAIRAEAIRDCIAAVKALSHEPCAECCEVDALAALRALANN